MATSTLCQSSPLGSPSGSPRSCLFMPRPHSLQPKADWRASFVDTNNENRAATYRALKATKPLILRQHNGVWLTPPRPVQPEQQSFGEKVTDSSPSKSRLSLGRVVKVLRCHVCLSTVKEDHFHNHLFFGAIRCELCFTICQNCRDLEWISAEAEAGNNKCQHKFAYCEDPYEYILPRLCGSDDHDIVGSSTLPHNLRVLQNYLTKLVGLQLREPWSSALRTCKKQLLRVYTRSDSEPSVEVHFQQDPLPLPSTMEDVHNKSTQEERDKLNNDISATLGRSRSPSPARRDSGESGDSDDGLLLTQSYDLQHLEQEVEYVELENSRVLLEQSFEEKLHQSRKPKKRRKTSNHKRTNRFSQPKKRTPSPMHQSQEEEDNLVMEEVELPEDGYYLMVREALEECPICYEALCPSMCTVNIRTFLFTVRCPECSLIIYMVPDLPDGIKIVTEDISSTAGGVYKQSSKSKTKNNVNPRDFFAR